MLPVKYFCWQGHAPCQILLYGMSCSLSNTFVGNCMLPVKYFCRQWHAPCQILLLARTCSLSNTFVGKDMLPVEYFCSFCVKISWTYQDCHKVEVDPASLSFWGYYLIVGSVLCLPVYIFFCIVKWHALWCIVGDMLLGMYLIIIVIRPVEL